MKRQQQTHERQESRPNQEPQQPPRQKQRVGIQEDSPTVDDGRGKRPRVVETGSQKMETDQVPESELPPVPEDADLNATVIEVMTDVEVLLDGSSVINVFAVNSARRKRVEVSERKLTESDRKLLGRQRSWSFNPGLITECLIWSRKSLLIKRESCVRDGS